MSETRRQLMIQSIRERVAQMTSGSGDGGTSAAIALRVVPVVGLMVVTGVAVLASTGSDDQGSLQATDLATAARSARAIEGPVGADLDVEPGRPPTLFIGDGNGSGNVARALPDTEGATTSVVDETTTSSTASEDADSSSTTSSTDTSTDSEATTSTSDRTTTTRRTTTSASSTTAAPTTQAPTTEAPTTQAPTTQPPTTQAPTTQPPTTSGGGATCASNGEFERVFRDDFNGNSVSDSWTQYYSAGNAGYGLRRPSANSVYDGSLWITAQMENGSLVSGGMSHYLNQTYGKYVIRVRTDNDPSQAVSGVVLTWPQSGVHPRDGENNIYETLVQTPNRNPFFTFIHKPYGTHSDQEYKPHYADGSQFQTMTMEWTPSRITIIREGPGGDSWQDVWTVNETGADLIPDVPHHLTLQLDGWKHSISGQVRMQVDFVEIHKYCG